MAVVKPTTIKEALSKCEEKSGVKSNEAMEILIIAQVPAIEKMDASLSTLTCCTKLSLSTNAIEKIANLNGLKHLKILTLGRNNIKSLTGLICGLTTDSALIRHLDCDTKEAVGDTLEELWISYNQIEKLKGINILKKLKVLFMSNNLVKDWNEFSKLADLTNLETLNFVGNPLEESLTTSGEWAGKVSDKLKNLKKLDGVPVIREEADEED